MARQAGVSGTGADYKRVLLENRLFGNKEFPGFMMKLRCFGQEFLQEEGGRKSEKAETF